MNKSQQEKLLRCCDLIESYFKEWHTVIPLIEKESDFISDLKIQKLICFQVFLILEEMRKMSSDIYSSIKKEYPYIQWSIFNRNRIGHQYHRLNFKETYGFIHAFVLPLEKELSHLREYIESRNPKKIKP